MTTRMCFIDIYVRAVKREAVVVLKIMPGHIKEETWDPINERTRHKPSFSNETQT